MFSILKIIVTVISSLVLIFFLLCKYDMPGSSSDLTDKNNSTEHLDSTVFNSLPDTSNDTITIIGVGDIMLGSIVPSKYYLPANNDCSPLLEPTTPILKNADVTFGNFEGVFTDTKVGVKKCNNPNTCFTFGIPSKYINCLVDAGFDVFSVANNHSGDFGERGRENTARVMEEAGMYYAGLESCSSTTAEKDGIRYGFCAFAPNRNTIQISDYENAQRIVKELDAKCDIVIVSFHGGAEGTGRQHITRNDEHFLGENRGNVYKFARKVIDAGADIVFGHGPHVTRAVDMYKDRFIIYSLGNFCTYSSISVSGACGIAPIIKVFVDKEGKFLKAQIIPVYQEKHKPTRIDQKKRVIKRIKELTKQDIPESELNISDDGLIIRK